MPSSVKKILHTRDGVLCRIDAVLPDSGMPDPESGKYKVWDDDPDFASVKSRFEELVDSKGDHVIVDRTPISNQGRAGSCVANAWCDMIEILDGLEGSDKVEQLSRRFLYWVARAYTGDQDADDGTFLRSAAHQLMKVGVVEEKWFEYNDSDEYIISGGKYATPETDLYTMASNNRLRGFYRVEDPRDKDQLKSLEVAIRSNHPFVFGAPVDAGFSKLRGMHVVDEPSTVAGWHAMICIGVTYDSAGRRCWLLRNSWSDKWGSDGYIKVTDNYVLRFQDVWVGTKMGELVQ